MNTTKLRIVRHSPFLSIQGEGVYVGQPSVFVRLAGCNLRCTRDRETGRYFTCDTPEGQVDFADGKWVPRLSPHAYLVDPDELASRMRQIWPRIRHIVVTGGEPLLQPDTLTEFLMGCWSSAAMHNPQSDFNVTLETNCTHYNEMVAGWITHLSLSPKLQTYSANEADVLDSWLVRAANDNFTVQVKIVCSTVADFLEAKSIFEHVSSVDGHHVCIVQASDSAHESLYGAVLDDGRYRFLPQLHKLMRLP
jgi:organic radical activating enzyme